MRIRVFEPADEAALIRLWEECELTRPWNDPRKDIARKLAVQPELFLVGIAGDELVASAMAGYDGHRGWIYYFAVAPRCRRQGYGSMLMREVERVLLERGCPKLNLQVRTSNAGVAGFYRRIGYAQDKTLSFGRRLIED